MQPDPSNLIVRIDLTIPLMGLYDSPITEGSEPLTRPEIGKHMCVFLLL